MVSSPEIRTKRRRATREPSPPNVSLIVALEAPQVLSLFEIDEVQFAPESELDSIAIMSVFGETGGLSERKHTKSLYMN